MTSKTKLFAVLEGAVATIGIHGAVGVWIVEHSRSLLSMLEESPPASAGRALPMMLVFAIPAVLGVFVLERLRRKSESTPPRLAFAMLMVAGSAAGLLVSHLVWSSVGRASLGREIASLEAEGLAPPTPSSASIAPADNAVPLLLQAQASFRKNEPNWTGSDTAKALSALLDRFWLEGTIGTELDTLRPLLETNREALELAAQAADKKGADWELKFEAPVISMAIPEHVEMLHLARLLSLQAIERARGGDLSGAAQSIRVGLAVSDAVGASPILISQMLRGALSTITINTARQIFDTPAELAIAEPIWASHLAPDRVIEQAKSAYRLDLILVPREMAKGAAGSPLQSFNMEPSISSWFLSPFIYCAMKKVLAEQHVMFERAAPAKTPTALPLPASRYVSRAGSAAARLAVAKGVIEWSKAPGDLAQGIGWDPFSGKPLRAIAASGGTLVFSVGPDGKDDGGARFDKDHDTGDISWLLRPDK